MNTLHFDDYDDFATEICKKYERIKLYDNLDSIDIVGKYEDIKEIMTTLIAFGYGIAFITEFANPEWDCYEDEFILSLNDDEVWCEPAKRETGYLHPEAKVVYLLDDCNSKIVPLIESDEIYEVEIGEYKCDGDCDNCELGKDKPNIAFDKDEDGNIHGFTSSKSDENGYEKYEYYSSEPIDYARVFDLLDSLF